jgi:hypothetical protein
MVRPEYVVLSQNRYRKKNNLKLAHVDIVMNDLLNSCKDYGFKNKHEFSKNIAEFFINSSKGLND